MTALLWATIASVLCLVVVAQVAGNVEALAKGTTLESTAGWVADLALLVGCALVLIWLLVTFSNAFGGTR